MNPKYPPDSSDVRKERDAYGHFRHGSLLAVAIILATALSIPAVASAFTFPDFIPSAFAAVFAPPAPATTRDSKLAVLTPATNSDPNPFKGAQTIETTEGSALIANTGPEGTIADVESRPQNDQISVYVVRPGDTLSEIASMFEVSANTILWANNLKSSKDIHPGDTLLILPISGIKHTVIKGETLASLAKKYGADASEIVSFNGLPERAALVVGSTVIIPGGELAAAAPAVSGTVKTGTASSPAVPKSLSAGGGKDLSGFWTNPLPGGIITQGVHDANGIDIGAKTGTPIYAAAGGTVIFVSSNGSYNHGWGNDVIINHGNGTQTLYAHMSRTAAVVGQTVSGGDLIGYVGTTGRVTGAHLHFEVRGARNPFAGCPLMKVCSI